MLKKRIADRINTMVSNAATPNSFMEEGTARDGERWNTFKFGKVHLSNGEEYPCILQDMSDRGMRIKLHSTQRLPLNLIVCIPEMNFKKKVELRWQENDQAGLQII